MSCVADLLGPNAEVVLHDVHDPAHSVADIRHGHVTGRKLGAPLTDLGYFMLRESRRQMETLGVYYSRTANGRLLKCNAANLRNERGEIEAILCINLDVTDGQASAGHPGQSSAAPVLNENYQARIDQIVHQAITDAMSEAEAPLTTEQKIAVVRQLDEGGVFLARGALRDVAAGLNVAVSTVYKYLNVVRKGRSPGSRLDRAQRRSHVSPHTKGPRTLARIAPARHR